MRLLMFILTSMNSTLALGPVVSLRILIATGIFTVSPSGTQIPFEGKKFHIKSLLKHIQYSI